MELVNLLVKSIFMDNMALALFLGSLAGLLALVRSGAVPHQCLLPCRLADPRSTPHYRNCAVARQVCSVVAPRQEPCGREPSSMTPPAAARSSSPASRRRAGM